MIRSFAGSSKLFILLSAAVMVLLCNKGSYGQIIATPNIEKLCKSVPPLSARKTVVYVDVSAIQKANLEWGLTILHKLQLAPREALTIVSINPSNLGVKEVFDACYPSLTDEEMREAKKGRNLFDYLTSLDPGDQQKENLQTFDTRLGNALDKIGAEAEAFQSGNRQNILGAIALDKNRYSDRNFFYRIVVYTNGLLKDAGVELNATGAGQSVQLLSDRYPANFFGADVLMFGVAGEIPDAAAREKLFGAYFLKSWAHLTAFSSALPQQDSALVALSGRMDGQYEGGGTQGNAKLLMFRKQDRNVAQGWITFNVSRDVLYVPIEGEYQCAGGSCKLSATCSESVPLQSQSPYFRKGDRIELKGGDTSLEGSLQPEGREIFKEGKQSVQYALKFKAQ